MGRTSWYHFFTHCPLVPLPYKHSKIYWDPELYLSLLCGKPSILRNTLPWLLCSPILNTHCSLSVRSLAWAWIVPSLFLTCLLQFPAPVTPDVRGQQVTPLQVDLILLTFISIARMNTTLDRGRSLTTACWWVFSTLCICRISAGRIWTRLNTWSPLVSPFAVWGGLDGADLLEEVHHCGEGLWD